MNELLQHIAHPDTPLWVFYDSALVFNLVMLARLSAEVVVIKLTPSK